MNILCISLPALSEKKKKKKKKLKDRLKESFPDLQASERTVSRARQELGWVHQTAKYAQLVGGVNKQVRLEWAEKMI